MKPTAKLFLVSALILLADLTFAPQASASPEPIVGSRAGNAILSTEVLAPANIFTWPGEVFVDSLPCDSWSDPEIPDTLERYTILTLGACQDTSNHEVHGVIFAIKRAADSPLIDANWHTLGDDSTGPFSMHHVDLWAAAHQWLLMDEVPLVGMQYDIVARTTDQEGHTLTWQEFVDHGTGATWQLKWASLITDRHVKRFRVIDHIPPIAHSLTAEEDHTPDSSAIFLTGQVRLGAVVDEADIESVNFGVREAGSTGVWTPIERVYSTGNDTFRLGDNQLWNTELLNGEYVLAGFARDSAGNEEGDMSGVGPGPTNTLSVFIDNERPHGTVTSVRRTATNQPAQYLERGAEHTLDFAATDNFGIRQVTLYYREASGDPAAWVVVDSSSTWPYTVQWVVPPTLVVGRTYDLAAVATDLVHLRDLTDAQDHFIVDTSFVVADSEAVVSIYSVGGQLSETTPHIHGMNVEIVAHSDSTLDHVRFEFIRGGALSVIGTIPNPLGTTVWTLSGWDVSGLANGPAQLIAVGSADLGGNLVTRATDTTNIIIDQTLSVVVTDFFPSSNGLLGGFCPYDNNPIVTRTLWIRFDSTASDSVTAVWFDYKQAADPNDPLYWHVIGQAIFDDSSSRWAYAWNDTSIACGLLTLRARVMDNAVPVPNDTTIVFADSVRMDNCPPVVNITNINGNPAPNGMNIGRGQVELITATVTDSFGNGGNSTIDSVAFYYSRVSFERDVPSDWVYIGSDTNGVEWQTLWDTGFLLPGVFTLHAVAWDHAGNCGQGAITVNIIDMWPQRAWIVGINEDSLLGCADRLYAATEDGSTNRTSRVEFEYSVNNGQTWIHLGETGANTPYCDANLAINLWSWPLELDSIPQTAIFRAVATDNNNNYDPNPPRFSRVDMVPSNAVAVFDEDWARVHVNPGQVPWVFGLLKGPDPTCIVNGGLVCANPVQGDSTRWAGRLDTLTRPCILNYTNGSVTVFSGVPQQRDTLVYMMLTTYHLAIHQVSTQGGSNGTITSEDQRLRLTVPQNGLIGNGTMWFEPMQDTVSAVPPTQPFYRLLSTLETVMSKGITNGTQPSAFRMYFDATGLPQNDSSVVAVVWNNAAGMWRERGITVLARHIDRVHADSSYVDFEYTVDWRISNDHPGCPNKARFAVMHTTSRPISPFVHFASSVCPTIPDSSYFGLDSNGVRTDCRPTFFIVLNDSDSTVWQMVTVFLDTVRIVNNGAPEIPAFQVRHDSVTGLFSVFFSPNADTIPPWFGCLPAGRHTVEFMVDNQSTAVTPFFVDRTGPQAQSTPTYITHQATIVADISDLESGVDTTRVEAFLRNCSNPGDPRFVHIGPEGIAFAPLQSGRGYRASFTVQWEQIQFMFPDTTPRPADELCVTWHSANRVCLPSDSTTYIYTIDVMPPLVTPIAPVGPGGREDTLSFGEQVTIEALVNDSARNGSGASGLNISQLQFIIDNHVYTPADTGNTQLNFHIIETNPYNADIRFGGPGAGPAVLPYYAPGEHRVTIIAPDSVGNIGAVPFGWSYFVQAAGPIVTFDTTAHACGRWFNPARSDSFMFCVDTIAGVSIAPNGIQYSVFNVTTGERISGPTVVNPANPAHECVMVTLSGSFPSGSTGIEIAVDAWNTLYNPGVDSVSGITHSRFTYWADNFPPHVTGYTPGNDSLLTRTNPIDIVVNFTDNSPDSAGLAKFKGSGSKKASAQRSRSLDEGVERHGGRNTLDDNGSGIVVQRVRMGLRFPNGQIITVAPDSANQFNELDAAHARFVLPAGQLPGEYMVSFHLEDCVGNVSDSLWSFRVGGLGPAIALQAAPQGVPCQFDNFWNPANPLFLRATIQERDSANVDLSGIRMDILRMYRCDSGLCQDTLMRNAPVHLVGEQPDPLNPNQTFTIADSFRLDPGANATEVRFLIAATNSVGISTSELQTWLVDATPPTITPTSPRPNQTVPANQPVTISATYNDTQGSPIASAPGGAKARGAQTPAIDRGGQPTGKGAPIREAARDDGHITGNSWRDLGHSGFGSLDAMSGIDTNCVTLHLRSHTDGSERDLTPQTVRTEVALMWTGTLAVGIYTATVTACDRVCNTSTVSWDFGVGQSIAGTDSIPPTITLISPPEEAILPLRASPTFVVQFDEEPGGELDSASIVTRLETINSQPVPGTLTIDMAPTRRTATASLSVSNLAAGQYILFTQVSDVAGNRSTAAFHYTVQDTAPQPPGPPELGDSLAYVYPNPFSSAPSEGGGRVKFSLPATGGAYVQIRLYDFAGMYVATVFDGALPQTGFEPEWRGENEHGNPVAGGVYLARVRMSAGSQTKEQILKVAFKKK